MGRAAVTPTLACMMTMLFASPCELPRPAGVEPQMFYYASVARDDDVAQAMRFTASTPYAAPVVEWRPEPPAIVVEAPPAPKRKAKKAKAKRTVMLAYAAPEEKQKGRPFLSMLREDSAAPVVGVDTSREGYREVAKAARKYGVETTFMLKVAKQESGGNCNAVSRAGARGPTQVMPGTAARHGVKNSRKLHNCRIGAETGVKEMARLLKVCKGDKRCALIGYNCGEACIKRKRLPAETKHYIKVIGGYRS